MNNLCELFIVDVSFSVFAKLVVYEFTFEIKWYHVVKLCMTNDFLEVVYKCDKQTKIPR